MNRQTLTFTGLIIAAVLFFAVNILSDALFRSARLDLTESRLYTVSEGTRNVLASLEEPLTLRFFFSSKIANNVPQLRTYGNRVRDLLEEYAALSDGMIRLEVIDPEPFSDAEDRAVEFGLQGVPATAAGDLFYFGLAGTNTTDDTEVIAFFQQEKEQFLEYDLTKFVYQLTEPDKPVVGVITSLPLEFGPGGLQAAMRGQSQPYGILEAMRQFFEVRILKAGETEIEEGVDVLVLLHARNLTDQTLYAIDQFVLGG
ncbi:MAG: GldG family protein, partial [Minwuiales bacterium]|nr:GldG family protein [Minwuiales bacterium]